MAATMGAKKHPIIDLVPARYLMALVITLASTAMILVVQQLRSENHVRASTLLQRPARASAVVQPFAAGGAVWRARARRKVVSCRRPGPRNHVANCKSAGLPAVEPSLATNDHLIVASAADYNSYNGRPQLGFYWSRDGQRWRDAGPLDPFPHADDHAAGDPLVAIDSAGVVYYAGMFFSYTRCNVGGVELLRRHPDTGRWTQTEIAANGRDVLQDRPGLALTGNRIVFAWTRFESCEGEAVRSRLKVALLPAGPEARPASRILDVPGSVYSQGAAPAGDGQGGFWLAWEEYPNATSADGSIRLARWRPGRGWTAPRTISPPGFRDLPEPLPGFRVDTSSVPAIAVSGGDPHVVWASADQGNGRISLWTPHGLRVLHDAGGDQLLPAVAPDGRSGVLVSFSIADRSSGRIDRLLWRRGRISPISALGMRPADDMHFGGRFLGWVAGLAVFRGRPLVAWPDLRRDADVPALSPMTALADRVP